jgi:hypothetical protein
MSAVQPGILTLYALMRVPVSILLLLFAHCWFQLGGRGHSQKTGVLNESTYLTYKYR